ncbi:BPIB4 protein, partial [Zapornia atra]|nr:BPIB4 protein [Zapornia atra]
MMMLKTFGIALFCGLLSPSEEVLSGLSCAVSPGAMQDVLTEAILHKGLLEHHLLGLVLPNIMGEGGLLNSPTSITGLHLVKVHLPGLTVGLLPGVGVQLVIAAKLELRGNCLLGLLSELISIFLDVNITATVKCTNFDSGTVHVVTEDCLCIFGAMKIKLLSGLVSLSVNELVLNKLTATLPGLLCPVVDIVVNLVGIQILGTLNSVIPLGAAGTVHYQLANLPFISGLFLGLDLDGTVKQVGGSIIPHDSSPSALPLLLDKLLVMVLRQGFMNAMLLLMIQIPSQTFSCTPEAFSSASQLQEAIMNMAPAGCSICRGTSPLSISLTLSGNPLIFLEENKATLELSVMIQVSVTPLGRPILNLLLLKADLGLNVHLSIAGGRLVLGLSLGSTTFSLESSEVGISDISSLKPPCSRLLEDKFLPLLEAAVHIGIPLPNVMGITLSKADVQI